jgi:hypothetical protein
VTLPDPEVLKILENDFFVGWKNIEKASYVGLSHGYGKNQSAVGTTDGAGGRNVQLVVLSPDLTVLHVLPGFWHPADLVRELRFAEALNRLWLDPKRSDYQKKRLFTAMHRAFAARFSADTIARSTWQGFDAVEEYGRLRAGEKRDTFVTNADGSLFMNSAGQPVLKPICELLHDRMAEQPFRYLDEFDMEAYTDYGRRFYDLNMGLDKGRRFTKAEETVRKAEAEKAKEAVQAAKERAKAGNKADNKADNGWSK